MLAGADMSPPRARPRARSGDVESVFEAMREWLRGGNTRMAAGELLHGFSWGAEDLTDEASQVHSRLERGRGGMEDVEWLRRVWLEKRWSR